MFRRFMAAALAVALVALPAFAQVTPDVHDIFQLDPVTRTRVKVGEIFVPDRLPSDQVYVEHWVLFPNYVYPSAENGAELRIVPAKTVKRYLNEDDFFRRVPFAEGSRYVQVTAVDTEHLPCR